MFLKSAFMKRSSIFSQVLQCKKIIIKIWKFKILEKTVKFFSHAPWSRDLLLYLVLVLLQGFLRRIWSFHHKVCQCSLSPQTLGCCTGQRGRCDGHLRDPFYHCVKVRCKTDLSDCVQHEALSRAMDTPLMSNSWSLKQKATNSFIFNTDCTLLADLTF